MLNQTTETAIEIMIFMSINQVKAPMAPKVLANALHESPSYIAKITGTLAKAGLLRGQRGLGGGVTPVPNLNDITLLEIVEACQGKILGDFCQDVEHTEPVCSYHQAMHQVHHAVIGVLKQWTLAGLSQKPCYTGSDSFPSLCRMKSLCSFTGNS